MVTCFAPNACGWNVGTFLIAPQWPAESCFTSSNQQRARKILNRRIVLQFLGIPNTTARDSFAMYNLAVDRIPCSTLFNHFQFSWVWRLNKTLLLRMIGLISMDIDHKIWDWNWNIGRINVESSSMHGNVSPFQWGEFPSFRLGEGPSHHWMFWRMGLLREGHCEGRAGRSALSGDVLKVCLCHYRVWVKICQELKMGWDGSKFQN